MAAEPLKKTDRVTVRRIQERGHYDRDIVYQILDEGVVCHVGFVVDGQPYVIPTSYARLGDRLVLHGSRASRMLRLLEQRVPACVTVTLLDGMVLARSAFNHSMNYRSVVVLGETEPLLDLEDKRAALEAVVEHLVPGRSQHARGPSDQEIEATTVATLEISEASAKIRTGPPDDLDKDMDLPVWAGVIPYRLVAGPATSAPDLSGDIEMPDYAKSYKRPSQRMSEEVEK